MPRSSASSQERVLGMGVLVEVQSFLFPVSGNQKQKTS
jgi:hypothetical protein